MTDTVTIQFSTTENSWSNRWSWVIRHMCHSPFSHVDIELPDGSLLGASDSPKAPVLAGNPRGVAIRPNNYENYGYRRRMVIKTDKADAIIAFAMVQLGKPFDSSAIKSFWSDARPGTRDWQNPIAWFCSELVISCFDESGYWQPRLKVWPKNRISPSDIFMLFLFDSNWTNRDIFWAGLDAHHADRLLRKTASFYGGTEDNMQPGISPTLAAWLNVAFLICTGIAAGTVHFVGVQSNTVIIIEGAAAFGAFAINIVLHAFASTAQGPLTKMLRR
jgi:hypothetical protein